MQTDDVRSGTPRPTGEDSRETCRDTAARAATHESDNGEGMTEGLTRTDYADGSYDLTDRAHGYVLCYDPAGRLISILPGRSTRPTQAGSE